MNNLVYSRFAHYLNLPKTSLYYILLLSFVFLFPLGMILSRVYPSLISKIIFILAGTIMGFIVISLGIIIFSELLRFLFPLYKTVLGQGAVFLSIILSLYAVFNAQKISIKELDFRFNSIETPVTLVHISDIHLGIVQNKSYLKKLIDKIENINPDFVAISGDLFDGSCNPTHNLISEFDRLKMPVFFSSGNHENYEGLERVAEALSKGQIQYLKNKIALFNDIQIIGVDNPIRDMQRTNPVLKTLKIDKNKFSLLLYHLPAGLDDAVEAGIDLQLSGHTHFGQIFPFNAIVKLAFKYGFGVSKYKSLWVYTSPGTGTWGPPMRLGSKNLITIIHLKPEKKG